MKTCGISHKQIIKNILSQQIDIVFNEHTDILESLELVDSFMGIGAIHAIEQCLKNGLIYFLVGNLISEIDKTILQGHDVEILITNINGEQGKSYTFQLE